MLLTKLMVDATLIRLGAQPTALYMADHTQNFVKEELDADRRESLLIHLGTLLVSLSR